jgi:hypothetical protein
VHPLLIKVFPTIPKAQEEALWFGRSEFEEQNKQTNKTIDLPS